MFFDLMRPAGGRAFNRQLVFAWMANIFKWERQYFNLSWERSQLMLCNKRNNELKCKHMRIYIICIYTCVFAYIQRYNIMLVLCMHNFLHMGKERGREGECVRMSHSLAHVSLLLPMCQYTPSIYMRERDIQ